ncbi:hypothetical protein [Leptolyngbya iicbica]|uniref:Uncharacterized protein n=2 Tax=Cyanophyceae TaxID=3028117 RepID=A0A4Q7E9J4_9CYAN|nr:hypothetical protein [Leptolyngbya sp. LK]RZM79527.1 hypothetical protein DYY88_12465 [Leptolyngbya sp. LK]
MNPETIKAAQGLAQKIASELGEAVPNAPDVAWETDPDLTGEALGILTKVLTDIQQQLDEYRGDNDG